MNTEPGCSQPDMWNTPTVVGRVLVLEIKGVAIEPSKMRQKERKTVAPPNYHIPSFKNSKRWVTRLPNGQPMKRPFLMSTPVFQKWRERVMRVFVSELLSVCRTIDAEMQTEHSQQSSTAWLHQFERFDDSVAWIPDIHIVVEKVPFGSEGALVTLERI